MISLIFTETEYADRFSSLGIVTPVSFDELRLLKTETDSAVCQKLNERTVLPSRYIYDREFNRYVLGRYVIFYELRGQYVVFYQAYSPGSNIEGEVGAPSPGWITVRLYDKTNLNLIGSIMF